MKKWFDTAWFGMFIHWGHSSQRGSELSWPLLGGVFGLSLLNVSPMGNGQIQPELL